MKLYEVRVANDDFEAGKVIWTDDPITHVFEPYMRELREEQNLNPDKEHIMTFSIKALPDGDIRIKEESHEQ